MTKRVLGVGEVGPGHTAQDVASLGVVSASGFIP